MHFQDMESKQEIYKTFFKWLLEKDSITLKKEFDLSLAPFYEDPAIYYPTEFEPFFETKAMQRIGKISQLGSCLVSVPTAYHSRLEHSKGTFNRKIEELITSFQDPKYKNYIEQNNLKVYLLAELIKEAGHDIGHLPLSHVLEIQITHRRDFHEEIGKRILTEDKEITKTLSNIHPDLPEALKYSLYHNILNAKAHDESNYDVDRLDYLMRDSLYLGSPISLKNEPYQIVYAQLNSDGTIKKNKDGSICLAHKNDPLQKRIDVYPETALPSIENFLNSRVHAYENIYFSPERQLSDTTISHFLSLAQEEESKESKELQDFITMLKNKPVQEIDIDEYLNWHDCLFYENCIHIAQKSENTDLKDMACFVIPPLEALMNFAYSSFELKNKKEYTNEERQFLLTIKNIIKGDDLLSKNLKGKNFTKQNSCLTSSASTISDLKSKYGNHINYSSTTVYGYLPSIPIFLENSDKKIFALHEHPSRNFDWENKRAKEISVAYAIFPEMRLKGLSDMQITDIKNDFEIQEKTPAIEPKVNLSPLKTEHPIEDYFDQLTL